MTEIYHSYDCARKSMGFCELVVQLQTPAPVLNDEKANIESIKKYLTDLSSWLDNLILIKKIEVWDLNCEAEPGPIAAALKPRVDAIYKPDTRLVYEFQMSPNDKTRAISNMLMYAYAGHPTTRMMPAQKNQICIVEKLSKSDFQLRCPVLANKTMTYRGRRMPVADALYADAREVDLTIMAFLKISSESYAANKRHTEATLEYWCSVFGIDISHVPASVRDDAADAFVQSLKSLTSK